MLTFYQKKKSFKHFSLCCHFNTHFPPKKNYLKKTYTKKTNNYINRCDNFLTKCYFHNTCARTTR